MKFYDREKELSELRKLFKQSETDAKMTVLTGRRRVGNVMAEIKFNKTKIDLEVLKQKARNLLAVYPTYKAEWLGLSLEDAKDYL